MKYILILSVFFLTACQTTIHSPMPEAYSGPTARIDDSFKRNGTSMADFFYIEKIDEKEVYNAALRTSSATSGQGANLMTWGHTHKVTTNQLKLKLVGRTMFAAPVNYMFNSDVSFEIIGEIDFKPKENNHYILAGELSKVRSAVWIEDITGNIVSSVLLIGEQGQEPQTLSAQEYKTMIDSTSASFDKSSRFGKIKGGESVERVVAQFGEPTSMSYIKPSFFSSRSGFFDYKYKDLGTVRFITYKGEAYSVDRVIPDAPINRNSMKEQLATTGTNLQYLAKSYYQQSHFNVEQLDVIAQAIWEKRHAEHASTLDGVAWLIKALAKQGDSRYYSFIKAMCDSKKYDSKITRHAKRSLKLLTPSEENQFKISTL